MQSFEDIIKTQKINNPLNKPLRGSGIYFLVEGIYPGDLVLDYFVDGEKELLDDLDLIQFSSGGYFMPKELLKLYLLVSNKREESLIDLLREHTRVIIKEVYDSMPESIRPLYLDNSFSTKNKEVKVIKAYLDLIESTPTRGGKISIVKGYIAYLKICEVMLTEGEFGPTVINKLFEFRGEGDNIISQEDFNAIVAKVCKK